MSEFTPRKAVALGLAAAIGLAANSCGGDNSGFCLSPRSLSRAYEGDSTADPNNRTTWRRGIRVKTDLPSDSAGLVVGFASPDFIKDELDWNDSHPLYAEEARDIALLIGPGAVRFSTRLMAKEGSDVCDEAPQSVFSKPRAFRKLVDQGAALPLWPSGKSD